MSFPKRHCPLVIALLSITIATRGSLSTDPPTNHQDPPFWQFILREYVFKTISSSRYQDDDLYKKLFNATFYGVSLPVASNDVNAMVSYGKVYNTPDGQWIFCQHGCTKCEPCDWQKGDPVVQWTLRRVKRLTSSGLPKWGLRLTVVPQMDESFHINKHPRRRNDNYVMHQDTAGAESSHKLTSSTQQAASFEKTNEPNFWGPNGAKLHSGSDWSNEESHDDRRRSLVQAKTYGSLERSPLTYYDVDQDINKDQSTVESYQDDKIPRLIVGIDQHGNKHLVHLIPVDKLVNSPDQSNNYATSYQRSYRPGNARRISRTIQQESDESSYEKLIVKILESFTTHRNFIEKFLFADRLESVDHNEGAIPSYSSYAGSADEKFEGGSFGSYRFDDSRPVNQYPSGSDYQTEEQGEQLRRYPVMTREVNKPYGEYQDQNSMIEYGPYGVSAQEQQHQDERSLPLANVDRKRRNSFGKLMDSTFGHEPFSQNHTQTDASDIEFSMRRDFLQNSANQALVNLAVKSNGTDAVRKLPEADFEMQTYDSDD